MASKSSGSESLNDLCQVFHLLSDRTRLQLVMMLSEGERDVTSLCKELHLAQPTVSHHLSLLRMNRMILHKRQGKRVIYSLDATFGKVSGGKLKLQMPPYSIVVEGL